MPSLYDGKTYFELFEHLVCERRAIPIAIVRPMRIIDRNAAEVVKFVRDPSSDIISLWKGEAANLSDAPVVLTNPPKTLPLSAADRILLFAPDPSGL